MSQQKKNTMAPKCLANLQNSSKPTVVVITSFVVFFAKADAIKESKCTAKYVLHKQNIFYCVAFLNCNIVKSNLPVMTKVPRFCLSMV